jgi:hypothetical protein
MTGRRGITVDLQSTGKRKKERKKNNPHHTSPKNNKQTIHPTERKSFKPPISLWNPASILISPLTPSTPSLMQRMDGLRREEGNPRNSPVK